MQNILIIAPLTMDICARYAQAGDELGVGMCFALPRQTNIKYDESFFKKYRTIYVEQIENESPELVSAARSLGHIDAVVAGGEFSVAAADHLAHVLGLRVSMNGDPLVLRNKSLMRRVFDQYKVPQPKLLGSVHSMEELHQLLTQVKQYPIISKPADMAGSWYVALNHNADEVKNNAAPIFLDKVLFSTGAHLAGECLLEEFVDGDEYSAEIIVIDSKVTSMFITRKFVSPLPYFDEIGHLSGPELLTPDTHAQVKGVVHCLVEAAKVCNSIVHMEFKLAANHRIAVIEAGCRVAGDQISTLVQLAFGFHLEKAMLLIKLGMELDQAQVANHQPRCYGIRFIYADISQKSIEDATTIQESMKSNQRAV